LRNRAWEPGETVEATVEEMPKDAKDRVAYFVEIKEKKEEVPEESVQVKATIDHKQMVEFDKPLNSMKKNELLALAKQLGMNLDPTIHHFTMRSMISKRLNGDTS
jgi:hypothetical protein